MRPSWPIRSARCGPCSARRGSPSSRCSTGPPGDQVVSNPRIVIVDDEPINVKVVQKYLEARRVPAVRHDDRRHGGPGPDPRRTARRRPLGRDDARHQRPGDPRRAAAAGSEFFDLPVIILTAATDRETKLSALRTGATEFLAKPVDAVELEVRLRNVLVAKAHRDRIKDHAWELEREVAIRTAELAQAHREVILCLAKVGEYRDNETGNHVLRVGRYAAVIARRLGMNAEFVARIQQAAALHDIGKVGIPDAILLKPGKLDEVEFQQMQLHCSYGRNVCASASEDPEDKFESHTAMGRTIAAIGSSPILSMATVIAYTHHEKWDGSGYPAGLRGETDPDRGADHRRRRRLRRPDHRAALQTRLPDRRVAGDHEGPARAAFRPAGARRPLRRHRRDRQDLLRVFR